MMPYSKEQIADFRVQLNELMKKMLSELEALQVVLNSIRI